MFERPNVIVPALVIGEPESTSIPSVPAIATLVTAAGWDTSYQLLVPSPSSLKNLEPPVSPVDLTAVPS